jgi:hypothetical protein
MTTTAGLIALIPTVPGIKPANRRLECISAKLKNYLPPR